MHWMNNLSEDFLFYLKFLLNNAALISNAGLWLLTKYYAKYYIVFISFNSQNSPVR